MGPHQRKHIQVSEERHTFEDNEIVHIRSCELIRVQRPHPAFLGEDPMLELSERWHQEEDLNVHVLFAGDYEKREPQYLDISIVVKQHASASATGNFFFQMQKIHVGRLIHAIQRPMSVTVNSTAQGLGPTVFVQPIYDWPVLKLDLSS